MNGLANRKKALTVLLAVMAAVCLAVALALTLPAERAFAENGEGTAERTPVVTYIIGDSNVTDESGFTYDEAKNTYTYSAHAAGWTAAVAKSAELYDTDNENANLVKVQIASDWVAQSDIAHTTSFGSDSNAFSNGRLYIPSNCNILLDLNGNIINRGLSAYTAGIDNGSVLYMNKSTLEIADSSENSMGTITGGYNAGSGGGIYGANSSKVILSGGTISNNRSNSGGGLNCGTVIINNGNISNNIATTNGGGVFSSDFTMNGGRISENETLTTFSNDTSMNGGAGVFSVYSITINNGSIIGNRSAHRGGGILLFGNAKDLSFKMFGGKIQYNTAVYGGGVQVVTQNTVHTEEKVELFGGEISYNTASKNYGGLRLYHSAIDIYLFGNTKVENNVTNGSVTLNNTTWTLSGGTASNLSIPSAGKINIANKLNESSVGLSGYVSAVITEGYAANNSDEDGIIADPAQYFISDNGSYEVILNADGEVQLTNQGALEWTVNGKDSTAIDHAGYYGASVIYSENTVTGISLKQGTTEITDIAVTDGAGNTISDLSANPLTNAGTYYATATVKGIGTATLQTKFTIVILPYSLESAETPHAAASGVSYALTNTTDWTADNDYTDTYDGGAKTSPAASVTLNSASLVSGTDYVISYLLNGESVTELKEVGTYTVVMQGTGNYTGTVYADTLFVITPDDTKSYTVTWQYYDGTEWKDLSSIDNAAFTYTSADYSGYVRVVLTVEGVETRYAYASGVTEYNLGTDEDINDVTHGLIVGIAKDTENKIVNAGEYALSMQGTPNYTVAEADKSSAVTVAKYNLANIVSGGNDTANISASLSTTVYDGEAKTLSLSASVTLNGNTVILGTGGAEYEYAVKYINGDGTETEVSSFILGGTYKIYIVAKDNQNFTGTLGVAGTVTIAKATNSVMLSGTGNWVYGTYDGRINGFNGSTVWLYDGTIDGTEQAYLYYTVKNADGEAVNATLTRFTSPTDEVVKALNALGAGNYTLVAEADETASYAGASGSVNFTVVKAANRWIGEVKALGWNETEYDAERDYFYSAALYGNAVYTVTDKDGNEVTDLANAKAGEYTVTVTVAETENYTGLNATVALTIGEKSAALTGGEIAGIVVMSAIVAGLAIAAVVLLIKRRKAV